MQEIGFIYGLTSTNPAIKIGIPIGIRFVDALLNVIRSINPTTGTTDERTPTTPHR